MLSNGIHTSRLILLIENLFHCSIWSKIYPGFSKQALVVVLCSLVLRAARTCYMLTVRALTRAKGGHLFLVPGPRLLRGTRSSENENGLTSGSKSLRASTFSRTDSSQSASDGVWRKIRVTSPQQSLSFRPGWLRRYGWLKWNNNETFTSNISAVSYMIKEQAEFWGEKSVL